MKTPQTDTPAQAQHSPLPWYFHEETAHRRAKVLDYGHLEICDVYGMDRETRNTNAAFIVRACNNAERLAEALKVLRGWSLYVRLPCGQYSVAPLERAEKQADAALAQWKGSKQ